MWCFQGLEGDGTNGDGRGYGRVVACARWRWADRLSCSPKASGWLCFVSSRCHTGEEFLARLSKVVGDWRKK